MVLILIGIVTGDNMYLNASDRLADYADRSGRYSEPSCYT